MEVLFIGRCVVIGGGVVGDGGIFLSVAALSLVEALFISGGVVVGGGDVVS